MANKGSCKIGFSPRPSLNEILFIIKGFEVNTIKVLKPSKRKDWEIIVIFFKSIDRDLNYSPLNSMSLNIVGPWYKNPSTAIPFWGFIILMISFSPRYSSKI